MLVVCVGRRDKDEALDGGATAVVNRVEDFSLEFLDGGDDARDARPFYRVVEVEVDVLACEMLGGNCTSKT